MQAALIELDSEPYLQIMHEGQVRNIAIEGSWHITVAVWLMITNVLFTHS